jgi:hypothetical protein
MVLLLATVAWAAQTINDDLLVNGWVKASGKISIFGSQSYTAPFTGWSGNSHFIVVRQPTPVSSGLCAGFIFSNNQTSGAYKNVAQLMFLNEAKSGSEKRVGQILVSTEGTQGGRMQFRTYDGATGTTAMIIAANGDITCSGEVSANVVEITSDRDAKENIEPLDSREVLEKVAALPMSTWSYKREDGAVRHMGPMSQDFSAAFGLGKSDTRITTVDADGVALAAIQGLNQKLEQRDAQVQALQREVDALKAVVANLIEK